ncbi:MAG: pantoate--beta-alanine ligase [Rikenellaceae bacterium]|jgi:pantoate--beta-alanine ligase|nr:pantoate--beta-alanine ligase [Rikenellaceae bacterium]
MIVTTTRAELAEALGDTAREQIKLVPTMGALHAGHTSLVRAAREGGGVVVVSVFVNPTQFNDPTDLRNYPRTPKADLALLEAEGADVVFMPTVEEIYPEPDTRVFDFGTLDKVMEGATRPGHFNGVAQVVSRLFELVGPRQAFFGQKDFQQVAVVRAMVSDLGIDVEVVECPIVREADGLAMSSRNTLLTAEYRAAAPDIFRALELGAEKVGEMTPRQLEQWVAGEVERGGLLRVIYCKIVDADTLAEATDWNTPPAKHACIAVQAGSVRLIDNYRY